MPANRTRRFGPAACPLGCLVLCLSGCGGGGQTHAGATLDDIGAVVAGIGAAFGAGAALDWLHDAGGDPGGGSGSGAGYLLPPTDRWQGGE